MSRLTITEINWAFFVQPPLQFGVVQYVVGTLIVGEGLEIRVVVGGLVWSGLCLPGRLLVGMLVVDRSGVSRQVAILLVVRVLVKVRLVVCGRLIVRLLVGGLETVRLLIGAVMVAGLVVVCLVVARSWLSSFTTTTEY